MRKVNYSTEQERDTLIAQAEQDGEQLIEDAILSNEKYLILGVPPTPSKVEIDAQVVEKIREIYTENDEFKMQRLANYAIANGQPLPQEFIDYYNYAEQCRAWGQAEKQRLGLIE